MHRQEPKKIKKSITPFNTYILSQHILQMMVQSTLTVFVLYIFFFNLANVYFTYFFFFVCFFKPFFVNNILYKLAQ